MSQAGWRSSAPASADQCRSSRTRPVGMDGPIISTAAVCGPTAAASWPGSTLPAAGGGRGGDEPGDAARQPDAVDQPGVDRVAEHDLLAGLDGGQQRVEYAVEAARDADAPGDRVVRAAGQPADVGRGRLAQRQVPLERAGSCWPRRRRWPRGSSPGPPAAAAGRCPGSPGAGCPGPPPRPPRRRRRPRRCPGYLVAAKRSWRPDHPSRLPYRYGDMFIPLCWYA